MICSVPSGPEMVQIPLVMGIAVVCCLGLALPVLQGPLPGLSLQVAKVAILSELTTTPLKLSVGIALGESFRGKVSRGVWPLALRAVITWRREVRVLGRTSTPS